MFEYHCPTKIIFGEGSIEKLPDIVAQYGKRPLLVCGQASLQASGWLNNIMSLLQHQVDDIDIFSNVAPNPAASSVNQAIALAKTNHNDVIIAVGGGSVLDTGKAIAVGYPYGEVDSLVGKTLSTSSDKCKALPLIAIPTTSGTGSEVTKGSIVYSEARGIKSGIRGEDVFPKAAIIDPRLALTMPESITIETAFDALTHAIESFFAIKSNPLCDHQSLISIGLIMENLGKVIEKPSAVELRERLSYAALLSGLNVGNASTCLPHRIQQAMGSVTSVESCHPRELASIYPHWVTLISPYVKDKLQLIEQHLGIDNFPSYLIQFIRNFNLDASLSDMGYQFQDMNVIKQCITGNVDNDPMYTVEDRCVERILEASFA